MSQEDARLEALKAKMTDQQRKDMSELLSNELKRRQESKSAASVPPQSSNVKGSALGGLGSREDVADIYAQLEQKKKEIRARKEKAAKGGGVSVSLSKEALQTPLFTKPGFFKLPSFPKKSLLLAGIICFALLKVVSSTGVVKASIDKPLKAESPIVQAAAPTAIDIPTTKTAEVRHEPMISRSTESIGPVEKSILTDLDKRRVELERRRQNLEQRELALREQEKEVLANLSELRSLTRKIQEHKKERNRQYEARMEQLASVYSSMAPKEAAPIVAKLDDDIALALLHRMPGKRMGQVLSMMHPNRAIDLTRLLTDKDIN